MRPAAHSLSFASPKESKQRKGDPDATPLDIRGVPCGARELGRLRKLALEYKDSDSAQPSPSTAQPPVHCAPQRRTRGSQRTSLRIGREGLALSSVAIPSARCVPTRANRGDAQRAETVLPVCGAEERSKLGSERYSRDFHALFEPLYPRASLRESPSL